MDVTISKKWKVVIAVVLVILAAPLYFFSNPGMEKISKGLWEKADDPKTPEKLYWQVIAYNWTWREPKAEALCVEWLKHYGGDETEKDLQLRYQSWGDLASRTFPFDGEENKRPAQRGEDFRPEPHPLTAKVLLTWASRLEDGHQLDQANHIYKLLSDQEYCAKWKIQVDADCLKLAQSGVQRNTSGSRSF